jgi:alpha-tubulin suppressor-like RCC1 family protein
VGNGRAAIAQPVAVGGISGATKIGTTLDNSCAVRNDGSVVCWGSNAVGHLGNGTRTYAPTAMRSPPFCKEPKNCQSDAYGLVCERPQERDDVDSNYPKVLSAY